jgi:drug/metabolite transporter (DMT)-like permease
MAHAPPRHAGPPTTDSTARGTARGTAGRVGSGVATGALSGGFVLAWSSGFLGARLGMGVVGTLGLLGWRFLLLAPALFLATLLLHRLRPPPSPLTRRDVAVHVAAGLLGQVGYLAGVIGAVQLGVGAGVTALIASLQPMLAGALAGPVLGERVSRRQWAGLSLGLGGVGLVVGADLGRTTGPPWAYALPFLGMAGLVAASLLERRAGTATPLPTAMTIQVITAAAVFVPLAQVTGQLTVPQGEPGRFWTAVACTTLLAGVGGYGLYCVLLRRRGVTRVSALLYLTPPVTGGLAHLLFGDPITVAALGGLAVCAVAVLLARPDQRRTRAGLPGSA